MDMLGRVDGKFSVEWDAARGSAVITTTGFWTEADATAFFPLLAEAAARSRARHGRALLLFDASNAVVQNGSLVQTVAAGRGRVLNDDDRVALVVASNLLKMQIKRNDAAVPDTAHFVSRSAADTWLHAHAGQPGRPDAG